MNALQNYLKNTFNERIDDRYELLINSDTFSGVVTTISSREESDALSLICQSMLAVGMNSKLADSRYCADSIVYAIAPNDGNLRSKAALKKYKALLNPSEIKGFVMWLESIRDTELGRLCECELDAALDYWKNALNHNG